VNPTLTATNHLSLATGRDASHTGVVSNSFRRPGSAITVKTSGFSASSEVETIWRAAMKRQRRVGVLLWPGADGGSFDRMADFGVQWPLTPLVEREVLQLEAAAAEPLLELPSADGVTGLQWRLRIGLGDAEPAALELLLAVFDGTPDGVPRYDQAAARRSDELSWSYVAEREWFQTTTEAQSGEDLRAHSYGAWSKVLRMDRHRGELELYRGAFWRLMAYPSEYQQRLEDAIGPWPGVPDGEGLEAWWLDAGEGIDLDTYLEQLERFDRYIDAMAEHAFAHEQFALLMSYHPTVDEYLHASLIVAPQQAAFSAGRALAAREGLKRVARSVDRSVGSLWRLLDPERDLLAVVSDHGMTPLHHVVGVNRVLADAGLLTVSEDGRRTRIAADTAMAAVSSGACSHLYLNLEGREPGGVVGADGQQLLQRAARALSAVEHEGEYAVERIVTREEAAELGLDHPASGDLIIFMRPGFSVSDRLDVPPLAASRYYGQHGHLNHHDELCGIFLARGAGVKNKRLKELSLTEVAPMVAGWLGIDFP
jgi:hypothetical protein